MSDELDPKSLLKLTALIVAAQVENNEMAATDLPTLIQTVYRTIAGLNQAPVTIAHPEPAVAIKKSVFPDHIVCLECGKSLKLLKRHLQTDHGLTPVVYRSWWDLPSTYPMVAPDYAARRSALAQAIGLGRNRKAMKPAAEVAPAKVVVKRRSRVVVPAG
jgi:predicted transcriptional regulator